MNASDRFQVLVVDDETRIRETLRLALEDSGHHVVECSTGTQGLERLSVGDIDVLLLDIDLPGMNGLEVLEKARDAGHAAAVIMLTGQGTVHNAWRAGQLGAFDFIEKPGDLHVLLGVVAEAGRVARLRRAEAGTAAPSALAKDVREDLGMAGASAAITALREQIRRIAPSQGRVLVTGENGSGKELVAHAIHALSKRSAGPFVKMNCAAIPRELVESELFGYERGAFTGAAQQKKGRLEMAHAGTLFLDEIGDLSLEAQAKLLRAIETGEAERVGGTRTVQFDVRYIAATNKDLAAAIEASEFREDLFYRLNVLPIHVPPLRERTSDLRAIAERFIVQFCRIEERPAKSLSPEALAVLEDYTWPGNVRELRNLMERSVVLVEGTVIGAEDLLPWLAAAPVRGDGVGLRGEIEKREEDAIRRALEAANWNVTQAASGLGIDRTNLHRKMRKYSIARR